MDAKEYLESKGYEFPDKDFWMEDYVTEHKFKDLVQLMEDYHKQKLNIASVSGKTEVCPDCRTKNLHHMGHGAWVCAFCGNNGKPMACASGAVDTKPAREVCIRGGEKLSDGGCSRCSLLWGKACAELP